uniref:Uncharacterized protein n=1 Tax=Oryza nivara TaxID=4536 RepID=A0A0E0HRE9_ORYNI
MVAQMFEESSQVPNGRWKGFTLPGYFRHRPCCAPTGARACHRLRRRSPPRPTPPKNPATTYSVAEPCRDLLRCRTCRDLLHRQTLPSIASLVAAQILGAPGKKKQWWKPNEKKRGTWMKNDKAWAFFARQSASRYKSRPWERSHRISLHPFFSRSWDGKVCDLFQLRRRSSSLEAGCVKPSRSSLARVCEKHLSGTLSETRTGAAGSWTPAVETASTRHFTCTSRLYSR